MSKQLPYTKLIEVNKLLIERLRNQVNVIRANRKTISAIAKELNKLGKCEVFPESSGNKIHFSASTRNLDGFKGRKLMHVLEKVSNLAGADFSSTDYPEYGNRDFYVRGPLFVVSLSCYLKDSPKNCQKVLVRVDREITEKPVYELRCS
jgi:hypothetical protein